MYGIFFINIFNRSIYVLIFNFFSDEYLIITTEDLKNSTLGGFFGGNGGIYQKSYNAVLLCMFYCVKFQVSNLNFIFLQLTWAMGWSYQKTI